MFDYTMFCNILTENFPRNVFVVLKSFAPFGAGMSTHLIYVYFDIYSLEYCATEGNLKTLYFVLRWALHCVSAWLSTHCLMPSCLVLAGLITFLATAGVSC